MMSLLIGKFRLSKNTNKRGNAAPPRKAAKPAAAKAARVKKDISVPERGYAQGPRGGLPPAVRSKVHASSSQLRPAAREFAKCLSAPQDLQVRVPDSTSRQTSVLTSRRLVPVFANTQDASNNRGKFSILVRPNLGYGDDPSHFQIAQVKTSVADADGNYWPVTLDSMASYVTNNGVDDLRQDKNFAALTQPPPSYFSVYDAVIEVPADPLRGALPLSTVVSYPETNSLELPMSLSSTGQTWFDIPLGQFLVTFYVSLTNSGSTQTNPVLLTSGGVSWLQTAFQRPIVLTANVTSCIQMTGILTVTNKAGVERFGVALTLGTGATVAGAGLMVTPTFIPELGVSVDAGILTKIRPVACSAYFRSDLSATDDAGNVAIYQLDQGECSSFFTNSSSDANPSNWEYVANTQMGYQGRLGMGAYGFWMSMQEQDYEMEDVAKHVVKNFGGICISGVYKPSAATAPNVAVQIGVLDITWVYEFNNRSTLFEKKDGAGSRAMVDEVREFFRDKHVPNCMSNDSHKGVIDNIADAVEGFGKLAGPVSSLLSWIF